MNSVRTIQSRALPPCAGRVCLRGSPSGARPYTTLPQVKHAESTLAATGNMRPWQRGQAGKLSLGWTIELPRGVAEPYSIEPIPQDTVEESSMVGKQGKQRG